MKIHANLNTQNGLTYFNTSSDLLFNSGIEVGDSSRNSIYGLLQECHLGIRPRISTGKFFRNIVCGSYTIYRNCFWRFLQEVFLRIPPRISAGNSSKNFCRKFFQKLLPGIPHSVQDLSLEILPRSLSAETSKNSF